MWLRSLFVWLGLLALAIANGAFREFVLMPRFGSARAHVQSTILLSILILGLSWWTMPWIGPRSQTDALVIGGVWLTLTLAFEFGFGRRVAHKSWPELFSDYDLRAGRIWPLVLITTFFAPVIMMYLNGSV